MQEWVSLARALPWASYDAMAAIWRAMARLVAFQRSSASLIAQALQEAPPWWLQALHHATAPFGHYPPARRPMLIFKPCREPKAGRFEFPSLAPLIRSLFPRPLELRVRARRARRSILPSHADNNAQCRAFLIAQA